MAGIYGPGRIPRCRELQKGLPIEAPSEGYLNLIHVDDAVAAVLAADELAPLPSLYCVSDGHPVVRREYFRQLAALLGAAEPRFIEPQRDAPTALRASASKRVSNQQLLSQLKFPLQYPSYREGLAAILRADPCSVPNQTPSELAEQPKIDHRDDYGCCRTKPGKEEAATNDQSGQHEQEQAESGGQ
jgi:nucleoside-diphosphate-sugar epimerase